MSSEVRTGLLALVAIALSLWGIKYIQGSNILSKSQNFYAYYDNVAGVQIGTRVQISGVSVGAVSATELSTENKKSTPYPDFRTGGAAAQRCPCSTSNGEPIG